MISALRRLGVRTDADFKNSLKYWGGNTIPFRPVQLGSVPLNEAALHSGTRPSQSFIDATGLVLFQKH